MISIGLPVYNGEQFLQKKLDSLLAQTFSNFEIIISDNASTDSTKIICNSYLKKDPRIKYYRQEKNLGVQANYNFVLQKAQREYFVWTAVDDIMEPQFLEKLLEVLKQKNNAIACMSNVKFSGIKESKLKNFNKFLGNFGLSFRPFEQFPIRGEYESKVNLFLKKMPWGLFYGIYKTEILKKKLLIRVAGFDALPIINALKYGDIEIINDTLLDAYAAGRQSEGMIQAAKRFNNGSLFQTIFLYYPLSVQIKEIVGKKIFWKNIHHIIRLNLDGIFLILIDILLRINDKIFGKGTYVKTLSNDY